MSWACCGKNSKTGQWMGYNHSCKCHKRGCTEQIDRGLSFVCGSMHEGGELGCGYYFCEEHHSHIVKASDGVYNQLCDKCYKEIEASLNDDGDQNEE